jgi:hypothetical protein
MSTSAQDEMADRKRVLDNDRKVREGTTMHAFSEADAAIAQGRFTQVNAANVVGSKENVAASYPACSPALAVQLPNEMPTGYRIDAMISDEPSTASPVEAHGGPADAPSGPALASEPAGSSASKLRRF